MVLQCDKERVRTMLKDAIMLLCKNSLTFKSKFSIEAVIGVTLDDDDVFLVSMNEIIQLESSKEKSSQRSVTRTTQSVDIHVRNKRRCSVSPDSKKTTDEENQVEGSVTENNCSANSKHVKTESVTADDTSDDIVFVKQEMDESWLFETLPIELEPSESLQTTKSKHSVPSTLSNVHSPQANDSSTQKSVQQATGIRTAEHQQCEVMATSSSDISEQLSLEGVGRNTLSHNRFTVKPDLMCSVCQKRFTNKSNLRRHVRAHYGIYPYRCTLCSKGFFSKNNLKAHAFLHTGVSQFKCELCGQRFRYKPPLRQHMIRKHANSQQGS